MRSPRRSDGLAVELDAGSEPSVLALIETATEANGPIDVFISNAGVPGALGGPESSDEAWDEAWRVNVMAHVWASRALLPEMVERGEGYLINTASAAGLLTQVSSLVYSVTKHAAVALAEWLSIEYAERGVRVSCICPQGVRTPMLDLAMTDAAGAAALTSGGLIEPEDAADAVVEGIRAERMLILTHENVAGLHGAEGLGPRALAAGHAPDRARGARDRPRRARLTLSRLATSRTLARRCMRCLASSWTLAASPRAPAARSARLPRALSRSDTTRSAPEERATCAACARASSRLPPIDGRQRRACRGSRRAARRRARPRRASPSRRLRGAARRARRARTAPARSAGSPATTIAGCGSDAAPSRRGPQTRRAGDAVFGAREARRRRGRRGAVVGSGHAAQARAEVGARQRVGELEGARGARRARDPVRERGRRPARTSSDGRRRPGRATLHSSPGRERLRRRTGRRSRRRTVSGCRRAGRAAVPRSPSFLRGHASRRRRADALQRDPHRVGFGERADGRLGRGPDGARPGRRDAAHLLRAPPGRLPAGRPGPTAPGAAPCCMQTALAQCSEAAEIGHDGCGGCSWTMRAALVSEVETPFAVAVWRQASAWPS